jgi:hypothetical protein
MRPVVLDTSVILPAVISPRGYRRRFLVVLALGAFTARRELLRQEADAVRAEPASTAGQLGGPTLEALAGQAEARYARLRDALPAGCPNDWQLVASRPLLAEYERNLREAGPRARSPRCARLTSMLCADRSQRSAVISPKTSPPSSSPPTPLIVRMTQ